MSDDVAMGDAIPATFEVLGDRFSGWSGDGRLERLTNVNGAPGPWQRRPAS